MPLSHSINSEIAEATGTSKLAKRVYDQVHEAYDGRYDEAQDRYVDYRTTFFKAEELARMAEQFEAGKTDTPQ